MEEMNKAGKKVALAHFNLSESAPQEHGNRSEEVQEGGGCRTESRTICRLSTYEDRQLHPYQFNEVKDNRSSLPSWSQRSINW